MTIKNRLHFFFKSMLVEISQTKLFFMLKLLGVSNGWGEAKTGIEPMVEIECRGDLVFDLLTTIVRELMTEGKRF